MPTTSFAITYTVKDEADLLQHSLPYYLSCGAERIYVFFDGSSDPTKAACEGVTGVEARDSVARDELVQIPEWIERLAPEKSMDHRKRINTMYAAEMARRDGIEWIANIDPDEIALPERGHANLQSMLATISDSVDQVIMPNLELLPLSGMEGLNPFFSQRFFIRRQDRLGNLWRVVNAITKKKLSPRSRAKLENGMYRFFNHNRFPLVMRNPMTDAPIYPGLFLGYNNCKSFMRSSSAVNFEFNIHKWQSVSTPLRSTKAGRLLHYDLPSFIYFRKKFQQRQSNMQVPEFDTRYQVGEIAREASEEVAREFYEQYICCPDERRAQYLVDMGIVELIQDVADHMEMLGLEAGGEI